MKSLMPWVEKNAKLIIAVFILISGAMATTLPDLRINTSTKSLVEEDAPYTQFYEKAKQIFGNEEIALITYSSDDALSEKSLLEINRLTHELENIKYVDKVRTIINAKDIRFNGTELESSPLYAEIPSDPAILAEKRAQALANPIFRNTFISEDGKTAAMAVYFKHYTTEEDFKKKILETTVEEIETILARSHLNGELHLGGLPIVRRYAASYMLHDVFTYVPCTLALVILVLALNFRNLRGVIFPLMTVFITILWTVGTMILLDVGITIITTVLMPLLVVITASYNIHFMSQYETDLEHHTNLKTPGANREAISSAFQHVYKPFFFIAVTTMAGFLSLGIAKIVPIHDMGVYMALGIAINYIAVNTFLPACLFLLSSPRPVVAKANKRQILDRLVHIFSGMVHRRPYTILVVTVLFSIGILLGFRELKVEMDNMSYFRKNDPVRLANEWICKEFSGINQMSVVIESDRENYFKHPDMLKKMIALQHYIESLPEVDSTLSIADFITRMNQAINDGDPNQAVIPEDLNTVSQYLLFYENSGNPDNFKQLVDYDFKNAVVLFRSNSWSMRVWREIARQIEIRANEIFPEDVHATVSGSLIITATAFDQIVTTQINSLLLAFATITTIMFILFRNIRLTLLSVVPNILPILLNFGFMGWLGIRLDLATSIIACVALGIGVDDTIHFTCRFLDERKRHASNKEVIHQTLLHTGKPMMRTTIAIVVGFQVFLISHFSAIFNFGLLTSWIMIICLLADLLLYPVLLTKLLPRAATTTPSDVVIPHPLQRTIAIENNEASASEPRVSSISK